jgi:RNA polymerase sigma factor (sigma-70 family)
MKGLTSLIRGCQQHDPKAQNGIYQHLKGRWMGICTRYVKDSDEAKDIFQEAVIKIFSEIGSLRDLNAFEGWARRIIVNQALNYLKARRSYLIALQSYGEEEALTEGDAHILQHMDNQKLIELISELPEGYRIVFNLFIIDGYKHTEIANMLDIAESTSRSQLNKARKHLKHLIETKLPKSNAKIVR